MCGLLDEKTSENSVVPVSEMRFSGIVREALGSAHLCWPHGIVRTTGNA